jgi:hypothetical protein
VPSNHIFFSIIDHTWKVFWKQNIYSRKILSLLQLYIFIYIWLLLH